ncbi:AI-2E family transporter [Oscillatoria sp. FACHB-1407]|uniref:AI-2E family transporter n=1 Tax=Oscillatoria sp. FACHB-1407 TaxID=2692847 RepID=UPI0016860AC2|nr:AI-2E family transporter [Oscillatoria sp. FACHB-1407]MBD2460830.1 AI-2E family transporter [Oscillatoria sp. FACHB-1407]
MLTPSDPTIKKLVPWLIVAILFPLIFLDGWLALKGLQFFQPLITVFVLASLLALVLNYPVQFLQRRGMKRSQAVGLILLITILAVAILALTLIPLLLEDLGELTQLVPQWLQSGEQQLQVFQDWLASQGLPVRLGRVLNQLVNSLPSELEQLADQVLTLALETVGGLSELLLTVVLTFYLLADGDRLIQEIFRRFPEPWSSQVREALRQNFQNYFIGQAALGFIISIFMTIAFTLLQIPYALLFGLGVGVMALIPFGDVVTFVLISLLLGFQNFWLGVKAIAIAFVVDQVIDQLIAPRLLGSFTGLRPIWVLISLLVGAKIGGLLGLVIAVPFASSIKSALNGFEPAASLADYATEAPTKESNTTATAVAPGDRSNPEPEPLVEEVS